MGGHPPNLIAMVGLGFHKKSMSFREVSWGGVRWGCMCQLAIAYLASAHSPPDPDYATVRQSIRPRKKVQDYRKKSTHNLN